jgi:hypothetical protein
VTGRLVFAAVLIVAGGVVLRPSRHGASTRLRAYTAGLVDDARAAVQDGRRAAQERRDELARTVARHAQPGRYSL